MNLSNMNYIVSEKKRYVKQPFFFCKISVFSSKNPKSIPFPFPGVLWYTEKKKGGRQMTLLDQIHQWYQAGEHEHTVNAVLSLPGRDRTDRLLGELILAYNNLGQYSRALLVLDELKPRLRYTWTWQYRRGYALYYSAYGASGLPKVPDLLAEAGEAFDNALKLDPPEHIRKECLEFLEWIREDLHGMPASL
jgi:tetratricopeptide (TPR) repeat protein